MLSSLEEQYGRPIRMASHSLVFLAGELEKNQGGHPATAELVNEMKQLSSGVVNSFRSDLARTLLQWERNPGQQRMELRETTHAVNTMSNVGMKMIRAYGTSIPGYQGRTLMNQADKIRAELGKE